MARIHFFRTGFTQWRRQAARRRRPSLVFIAPAVEFGPAALPRRYGMRATIQPLGKSVTIQIGEFVISSEGDPRILGHPQIRY